MRMSACFLVIALLHFLAPAADTAEVAQLSHETLFDPQHLVEVHIEMEPQEWTALRSQTRGLGMAIRKPSPPTPFTYFKANVTIDGHLIESVGIRKKGFVGSLDQSYPSLKIKFDEYVDQDPIEGLGRLTLNNNKQDSSLISQFLAYRLFSQAELPAPRCNFARVTVNDEYLGIYSNVESIKKSFLKRQFGTGKGKLYEGTLADLFVDRIDDFEAKVKGAENREELRQLAEVLQPEECDLDELSEHLDIGQFLRFWALESLINCWDGYANNQNNYFVYHNPADSRFHFIPWGADATCSSMQFMRSKFKSVHTKALLTRRLYQANGMADRYRETLLDLLDSVWNEEVLSTEINRLEEFLKDHVHSRQRGFKKGIEQTRRFVRIRRDQLMYELDRWPVRLTGRPLRPTYSKSVGSVVGTFSADWVNEPPKSVYEVGEAELSMVLDGEPVELSKLGVYGQINEDKEERTILFVGKRKSNRIRVKLRVGMSDARFRSAHSERPIVVQGNLEEGGFGLFGILSTQGLRLVGGMLTVTNADSANADTVTGSIELDVLRFIEDK